MDAFESAVGGRGKCHLHFSRWKYLPDSSWASPDPGAFGQARAGALREDFEFTAFRIAVDLVDAEGSLEQDFGILARVSSPGLGTLNGYSATFDSDGETLDLSRVDGEQATTLESIEVPVEEGKLYRLVFHGYQEQFLIEVFDIADLTTPVVSLSGVDGTYPAGTSGIFSSAGMDDGAVDVTFDRFSADSNSDVDQDGMSDHLEASVFGNLDQAGGDDFDGDGQTNAEELQTGSDPKVTDLIGLEINEDRLMVSFFFAAGRTYALERSVDLMNWAVDAAAAFVDQGGGIGRLEADRNGGREFVRVKVGG